MSKFVFSRFLSFCDIVSHAREYNRRFTLRKCIATVASLIISQFNLAISLIIFLIISFHFFHTAFSHFSIAFLIIYKFLNLFLGYFSIQHLGMVVNTRGVLHQSQSKDELATYIL